MPPTERAVVDLYRSWQDALARHGDGPYAADLFHELAQHIECNVYLDKEGFQSVLEQLHAAAFPTNAQPRLVGAEADADILEPVRD
jgi:hypothetical protein